MKYDARTYVLYYFNGFCGRDICTYPHAMYNLNLKCLPHSECMVSLTCNLHFQWSNDTTFVESDHVIRNNYARSIKPASTVAITLYLTTFVEKTHSNTRWQSKTFLCELYVTKGSILSESSFHLATMKRRLNELGTKKSHLTPRQYYSYGCNSISLYFNKEMWQMRKKNFSPLPIS